MWRKPLLLSRHDDAMLPAPGFVPSAEKSFIDVSAQKANEKCSPNGMAAA